MAHLTVQCFSNVLGHCITFEALLPETATNQIGMNSVDGGDSYPVLYLLHGYWGTEDSMLDPGDPAMRIRQIVGNLIAKGEAKKMIVVFPYIYCSKDEQSFYSDMQMGRRYWTFLSEELPNLCRCFFPRISPRREDTFAAGLSMGGYGAFKLALRRPDRFCAAASLSGVLDISAFVGRQMPGNARFWNAIYESPASLAQSEDDLFVAADRTAKAKDKPLLFACCGTEDFLHGDNLHAVDVLRGKGLDVTYEEGEGTHNWVFWDKWIQRALDWLPIRR